jgi:Coenzyme PQQ synthesis protein D (PqqD)
VRYHVNHPQVINETIEGEAIMINLVTGNYYSLDTVGGEIWELLEQSLSAEDIVTVLGQRYEASEEVIRNAVVELLAQLASEQLVVRDDGRHSAAPPASTQTGGTGRLPFEAPKFEKFTDMPDLILLDPVHDVDQRGWPYAADSRASN